MDSGNIAVADGSKTSPPFRVTEQSQITSHSFISTYPYASSFQDSNGSVRAYHFATRLGLPSQVADVTSSLGFDYAPADALYVVTGGGNDARAALTAIAGRAAPATAIATVSAEFAADISTSSTPFRAGPPRGRARATIFPRDGIRRTPAGRAILAQSLYVFIALEPASFRRLMTGVPTITSVRRRRGMRLGHARSGSR